MGFKVPASRGPLAKMEVYVDTLCLLAQPKKGQQQFKNKKTQPELTEIWTLGKSDNQGVKEETFIQTGKKSGDGQVSGEDSRQGGSWRTVVGKVAAGIPSEAVVGGVGSPTFTCG